MTSSQEAFESALSEVDSSKEAVFRFGIIFPTNQGLIIQQNNLTYQ